MYDGLRWGSVERDTVTEKFTDGGNKTTTTAPAKRIYSPEYLAERERLLACVMDEGEKRIHRSVARGIALGIIDKDGNRLKKELPVDVLPGSDRDFGGWQVPTMHVVAGPAGSGKSTAFPGDGFGCDYFNSDNYAAMLNGGSYTGISKSIRAEVGPICERFIQDHIEARRDFATETTLRSPIVFDQMRLAHEAGFEVEFLFICVDKCFQGDRPGCAAC
jgi:Zeta toxin